MKLGSIPQFSARQSFMSLSKLSRSLSHSYDFMRAGIWTETTWGLSLKVHDA